MSLRVSRKVGLAGFAMLAFSGAALMGGKASALTLTADTVVLEEDVTDGIVVEAGNTVTLDLNGHSVTNTATGMAAIINRGVLTVTGEGSVSTDQNNTAAVTNYPDATLTLSGGSYASDKWYIVRNYGAMTINDGVTVTANEQTVSNASMVTNGWYGGVDQNNGAGITANSGSAEPTLTINGGTFTAGLSNCSVIKNDDYSNLVINVGSFSQPRGSLVDCDAVILNWNVAEIKGGTFFSENGPVIANGTYADPADKGLLTISGGTFTTGANGTVLGYGSNGNGTGALTVTGGTFSTALSPMPVNPNAANDGKYYTISITGGTYGTSFSEAGAELIAEGYGAYKRDGDVYVVLSDADAPKALTAVNLSETSVTVALGEEKYIAVSYNEGFLNSEIDGDVLATTVSYKSGTENAAYVGFEVTWEDSERISDYDSIYVYGNQVGTAVYTVKVTDKQGNVATKDITVVVEDALSSDYGYDEEAGVEAGVTFETPVEGGRTVEVTGETLTDELQALDDDLKVVLDITVKDEDGNTIEVADNEITVWVGINKELVGDATKFQIVYIKDGKILEYFDPTEISDDGWGWIISFKTTHLSQYGILASTTEFESAEDRNALIAPDTGVFTAGDGSSMDYRGLIATVVAMTTMVVVMEIATYRKNQTARKTQE